MANHLEGENISVFVPTTPNPISGFILIVPRTDVIELNMSEEAVDDFYFTRFGHGRQAVEEGGAVVFAGQARVGEDEDTVRSEEQV